MKPTTKIEWHNERRKIDDLIPFSHNPRAITDKQREDLKKSLEKFGLAEVPAINTDNTILAGHQRLKILQLLGRGKEEIDVRVPNRLLSEEEAKEYNIRSNKNTGYFDDDMLAEYFSKEELVEWGFEGEELMQIWGLSEAGDDIDIDGWRLITVEPPEAPVLKERASIYFEDIQQYYRVKEAIMSGKIRADDLIELL